MYYLETEDVLPNFQCDFWEALSNLDHLVCAETRIREVFVNRLHCISVFINLEKACDMTWWYRILQDICRFGLRGRMVYFTQNFLCDRTFWVQIGTTLSEPFLEENGLQERYILSLALFAVNRNSIGKVIPRYVSYYLWTIFKYLSLHATYQFAKDKCSEQLTMWAGGQTGRSSGFPWRRPLAFILHKYTSHFRTWLGSSWKLHTFKNDHQVLGLTFQSKLTVVPTLPYSNWSVCKPSTSWKFCWLRLGG